MAAKAGVFRLACLAACALLAAGCLSAPGAGSPVATPPSPSAPARTPRAFVTPSPARPRLDAAAAPTPTAVPDVTYRVPILMYHRIVPATEAGNSLASMWIEPGLFRAQLTKLHDAGWTSITLAQLASAMRAGKRVPARTFAITIDDGWADGYSYAFPIMRDLRYRATYFVITNRIGESGFLSAPQLLDLEAAGDEIGNHTRDHADLTTLDFQHVERDIDGGADALERVLGHRPVSFAYPKAGVAPYVIDAASACPGLQIAVTTMPGSTESWRARFELPRLRVDSTVSAAALLAELERA